MAMRRPQDLDSLLAPRSRRDRRRAPQPAGAPLSDSSSRYRSPSSLRPLRLDLCRHGQEGPAPAVARAPSAGRRPSPSARSSYASSPSPGRRCQGPRAKTPSTRSSCSIRASPLLLHCVRRLQRGSWCRRVGEEERDGELVVQATRPHTPARRRAATSSVCMAATPPSS